MKLTVRMPAEDGSTIEERVLEGGTLTLGRGAANDWVLADPERVLSKNHCRIDRSDDGYVLTDVSTNGVFLAGELQPIGRGRSRALHGGDVIVMGPYHFEVLIDATGARPPAAADDDDAAIITPFAGTRQDARSPITSGAHEPWLEQIPGGDFGPDRHVKPQGWEIPLDPADYAAAGLRAERPLDPGPLAFSQASEHGDAVATVMRLPEAQSTKPALSVLPTNWMDSDPMAEVQLAPTPLDPVPSPFAPEPIVSLQAAPLAAQTIPIPNEDLLAPHPDLPPPAVSPAALPVPSPTVGDGTPTDVMAAFLAGAGLSPDALAGATAEEAAFDLGRLVRAAVEGAREILATRAMIKSELRVEQTSIRATDNNAMKFAPDIQRCLDAMVGQPPRGFMPGSAAMQQAMTDIKAHELALIAALNGVFATLTEKLDPETISAKVRLESGLTVVPIARKSRCWEMFVENFQALQGTEAQNTGGSLLAPLAAAYARQLRRSE